MNVEPEISEKQAITKIINSGWLVKHDKELREKWERPKGEWEYEEIIVKKYYAKCPFCDFSFEIDNHRDLPYFCGACGAVLRGGAEMGEETSVCQNPKGNCFICKLFEVCDAKTKPANIGGNKNEVE